MMQLRYVKRRVETPIDEYFSRVEVETVLQFRNTEKNIDNRIIPEWQDVETVDESPA